MSAVYFKGYDASRGWEPWRSDGTASAPVADVNPGSAGSDAGSGSGFIASAGFLYFNAYDATHGYELWRTDGKTTKRITDLGSGSDDGLVARNGAIAELNGHVYFAGTDGIHATDHGYELWRTDGTAVEMLYDIHVSAGRGSDPGVQSGFAKLNDQLYFSAEGYSGWELWRTDGTRTEIAADINPSGSGSYPGHVSGLEVLNGWLYFDAYSPEHGDELWRTNGTTTELVADINAGDYSRPGQGTGLTKMGGYLYFSADDGLHGRELWRTNGMETSRVTDINPGSTSRYNYLSASSEVGAYSAPAALKGWLYFDAYNPAYGSEVWRTDGTMVQIVADILPGADTSAPGQHAGFTSYNGAVYFSANDGIHGHELWRTDGTSTEIVADLNPGAAGSNPQGLTVIDDEMWFFANSTGDAYRYDVWKLDSSGLKLVSADNAAPDAGFGVLPNRPPVVEADKVLTVQEDSGATSLRIMAPTDQDGDILAITVTDVPSNGKGTVMLADGSTAVTDGQSLTAPQLSNLSFMPAANANGAAGTFAYSVSDGNGGTASQKVSLAITPVNDPPALGFESLTTSVNEDATTPNLWGLVFGNGTDMDGDALTLSVNALNTIGAVRFNAGTRSLTYTASDPVQDVLEPGQSDTAVLSYSFSDGNGGEVVGSLDIVVNGVLEPVRDGLFIGTAADDLLQGSPAAERMNGGDGNDLIIGAGGDDIMNGGDGNDVYVLEAGFGRDTIIGFGSGLDRIDARGYLAALNDADVSTVSHIGVFEFLDRNGDGRIADGDVNVSFSKGRMILSFDETNSVSLVGVNELAQEDFGRVLA